MRIDIRNLNITYQKTKLLNDLSVTFERGKLSCLLGPSGSGKTTLLKIIAGVSDKFDGDILFDDERVNNRSVAERLIGWVPQQQLLFHGLNVRENIEYGLKARKYDNKIIDARVREISKLVGVDHLCDRFPEKLSGGERQRVAIARALAPYPKLLLLDEPFSSLDAPERDKLALILREIQLLTKITTIHVTHSPREAELLADKIHVLAEGVIHQSGSMNELQNKPKSIFVASLIGLANVFADWNGKPAIIPRDAVTISNEGTIYAKIIAMTSNYMYIKTGNNRLEIFRPDKEYNIGDNIKISIDNNKINYMP